MGKKGVIGSIIAGFLTLVLVGLFVAVLRSYNWDFVALVEKIAETVWGIIDRIAQMFTGNRSFRQVVATIL